MSACRVGITLRKSSSLPSKLSIAILTRVILAITITPKLKKFGIYFGIKHLGEYHDLYVKTDVILLSNIFKAFRKTCLKHYPLDLAHFYMSPGLAWQACLKKTGIELEL